ncbi:MAG: MOSC domain-containing protein [Methanobacteriaceae archaeon]
MQKLGKITAVCTSPRKQTKKRNIKEGIIKRNYGLEGDAHSTPKTHRQVSLLAEESIHKMREMGLDVHSGDFAENLTTKGIELTSIPLGTMIQVGKHAILEVTQIGKVCHTRCAIYKQAGDCIMPREGIFTKVLESGRIKIGDMIKII